VTKETEHNTAFQKTLNDLEECLSITSFLNLSCNTIMAREARNLPQDNREAWGAALCFYHLQDRLQNVIAAIEGEKP
jgi:hypothetical protein